MQFVYIIQVLSPNVQEDKSRSKAKHRSQFGVLDQQALARGPEQNRTEVEEERPKHTVQNSARGGSLLEMGAPKHVQADPNVGIQPQAVGNQDISVIKQPGKKK